MLRICILLLLFPHPILLYRTVAEHVIHPAITYGMFERMMHQVHCVTCERDILY